MSESPLRQKLVYNLVYKTRLHATMLLNSDCYTVLCMLHRLNEPVLVEVSAVQRDTVV